MAVAAPVADRNSQISRRVLEMFFQGYGPRDFTVRFSSGEEWGPDAGQPSRFTLALKHPGSVRAMFWPPSPVTTGKAYIYDDFDVEGDMHAFLEFCNYLYKLPKTLGLKQKLSSAWNLLRLPDQKTGHTGRRSVQLTGKKHSVERDRAAVTYHYNVPNPAWEKILGPTMGYTMGIFDHDQESVDAAQERKFDLLCRKMRIKPGDKLLDIGCGWGGLMMHAARHYGAETLGVTISETQVAYAVESIARAGLSDRCRVELRDYRDIPLRPTFDQIVIVEVLEHFGVRQFPDFFRRSREMLQPCGRLMLQQITLQGDRDTTAAPEFNQEYVFPDGELAPTSTTLRAAETAGLEIRDVESFREHYVLTLRRWLENAETHHDEIVAATDEANFRVFRLYFAGAAYGFRTNVYNVHQMLFVKPDGISSGMSLARTT
ncbi:MAG: cyclopropane-fatty-acyl-phospholipid synthase family protein [Pirellulales bacterium]